VLTLLYIAFVFLAVRPVALELTRPLVQHLVFGSAAVLAMLWWLKAGIHPGLDVHFMWLTALTLTLGWRWALFSSALSVLVYTLMGGIEWLEMAEYGLIGCALPILFSYAVYSFAFHYLPRHYITYIFFCSFMVGALSIAVKMLTYAGYYYFTEAYTWSTLVDNYLVLIPLLLFPEGLLNGMAMTLLVIYKPHWVKTFYDEAYLR